MTKSQATQSNRRYLVRFTLAMASYMVLLVAGLAWLGFLADDSPWRVVAIALPIPALVAVVWAVYRYIMEADEMLSRDTTRALAIGFGVGSVVTFSYGLFQLVGAPPLNWMFVWAVYAVCWLLGGALVRRAGQ